MEDGKNTLAFAAIEDICHCLIRSGDINDGTMPHVHNGELLTSRAMHHLFVPVRECSESSREGCMNRT